MPGKRAKFIAHPSPAHHHSRKRRKTSSRPSRFYTPRSKPDDPYVTESDSDSEVEDDGTDAETRETNKFRSSRSVENSQSTLDQTTSSDRSFTSRTYISESPHPRKGLLRSRNLLGISTRPDSAVTQHRAPRLRQRQRTTRPLSPLPVNHSLARYRSLGAKRMPLANNNKRSRDPSVIPSGIRITRRTSGVIGPPNSGTATPDPKRKRSSGKLVESDSSDGEAGADEEEEIEAAEQVPIQDREADDEEELTETEGEGQNGNDALGNGASLLPVSR